MSEAWESAGRSGRSAVDPATLPRVSGADVPLRRILALFAPHRARLSLVFALSLVGTGIGLLPPLAMKRVIDVALPERDARMLLGLVAVLVVAPLSSGLVGLVHDRLNHHVGQAVMRDLRLALFRAIERQAVSFFTRTQAGELVQRLTGDVHFVQGVVTGTVVDAATQIVTLVATAGILFALDWRLALMSVLIVPLFALPLRAVTEARRRIRRDTQRARSAMAVLTTEAFGVSGALLIRMFARGPHVEGKFTEVNQRVMDLELRFNAIGRGFTMVTAILGPLGTAALFLYGGLRVIDGQMTVGAVFAFSAYLGQLLAPAARLLNVHVEVSAAAAVFQRLFEVLDIPPALVEAPGAGPMSRIAGRIQLRDVSFTYHDGTRALEGVSVEIRQGSVVALVGPSGGGKSTLMLAPGAPRGPHRGRGPRGLHRSAQRHPGVAPAADRLRPPGSLPLPRHSLEENLRFAKLTMPATRRSSCRVPARPRRRRGRGASPTASRPWSASGVIASPAGSASGSPSPARCSPSRGSSCSTRRRRTSTQRPRRRSGTPSRSSCAGGRRW